MATFNNNVLSFNGHLQMKRGTADALNESDYVPVAGELLVATDTGQVKPGDGVHTWRELPTFGGVDIANSFDVSDTGKALDAAKGKELNERLAAFEQLVGIDCGVIPANNSINP